MTDEIRRTIVRDDEWHREEKNPRWSFAFGPVIEGRWGREIHAVRVERASGSQDMEIPESIKFGDGTVFPARRQLAALAWIVEERETHPDPAWDVPTMQFCCGARQWMSVRESMVWSARQSAKSIVAAVMATSGFMVLEGW